MPESYEWRENNACVATYNVLESDQFLDQFEDSSVKFKNAGDIKLKELRYYPNTTNNSNIIEIISFEMARKFLTYITKIFTVKKQNLTTSTGSTIEALAGIFSDGNMTIRDLAQIVDANVKFPDEL